jgi:hypothetical protein
LLLFSTESWFNSTINCRVIDGPEKRHFISKMGLKGTEISHICKAYFKTWNSKKRQWIKHITLSNTFLCPAIYRVKQYTVSTLVFNMHLFNFLLSTCWCRSMPCPTLHVLVSSDVHYHGSHARSSLCFFFFWEMNVFVFNPYLFI